MSYSSTYNQTFTITNAKYLAAKISADLKRMQRFYGAPSDYDISSYEEEIAQLLKHGYLSKVTYGFKKDGRYIEPTLVYKAETLASAYYDDNDPGRVKPGADISGASFYSYLNYSPSWDSLSASEKESFKKPLPVQRTGAAEPTANGYWSQDKTYSSGGKTLNRSTLKSY